MKIKVIMIPKDQVNKISLDSTVREALKMIDEHNMLSLPVLQDNTFIGALSKQHVYETFFKEFQGTKEEFLDSKINPMMRTKIPFANEDDSIDKAAAMFISSKFRFIPVVDEQNEFAGIVTQQAVFKEYQKLYGADYNSLTIYVYDYQGTLARMATVIAKAGGNIKNTVVTNTDIMGLHEVFLRIESDEFDRVVRALVKEGYDVRR